MMYNNEPQRPWMFFVGIFFLVCVFIGEEGALGAEEYNVLHRDGSYEFGYDTPDSYHRAQANRYNVVKGEFGARSPKTGAIDTTVYTAGPRGFRPRGRNIVRKYDLSQIRRGPIGNRDDPYYDPNEDPSYSFGFRTRTYDRQEVANSLGDVTGRYSYIDDIGERHNVEFIAGKNTGFHVKTPFPDSNPRGYGSLFFNGRGKPLPRGRTSIQRGLDGSYRFVSTGPDQRRTESSDSTGHVRGSYTYLDDKGVQHSVHYIAGPGIGYRVLKNVKGPHLPSTFPFGRPDVPTDFYDYVDRPEDVFDTAASGHVKPPPLDNGIGGGSGGTPSASGEVGGSSDQDYDNGDYPSNNKRPSGKPPSRPGFGASKPGFGASRPGIGASRPSARPPSRPFGGSGGGGGLNKPSYEEGDDEDVGDVFGGSTGGSTSRPSPGGGGGVLSPPPKGDSPPPSDYDENAYKPSGGTTTGLEDGSYKPSGDDGSYRPDSGESGSAGVGGNAFGFVDNAGDGSKEQGGSGTTGSRPQQGQGGGDYDSGEVSGDFGLFDDGSAVANRPGGGSPGGSKRPGFGSSVGHHRPTWGGAGGSSSRPGVSTGSGAGFGGGYEDFPSLGVGFVDGPSGGDGGFYYKGGGSTIIRNLGDKHFSVPPGVSVRAHVQAIDLLPLGARRVPSPSEQFKEDTKIQTEQLNEAATNNLITAANTNNNNNNNNTTHPTNETTTTTSAATTTEDSLSIFDEETKN